MRICPEPAPRLLAAALCVIACGGTIATPGGDAAPPSDGPSAADAPGTQDAPAAADAPGSVADAPGSAADAGPPPCTLTASGPIASSGDGQVIEYLRITSTAGAALTITHANVTVRHVDILHAGGPGIRLDGASDAVIEDVAVLHTGAPAAGANDSSDRNNIECWSSPRPTITRVRLTRGSSGVYLVLCPGSRLSFVEGHDFRGPFPRGQLVQWDKSPDGLLEDFSVVNPPASWPEDNVNVYQCDNVTIRRGHIDGNNSPSGVGVIFDGGDSTGLVEDVDAIRMGNGCFSNYDGGSGTVFRRTRCRENICADQGRGAPLSNALMWAGNPSVGGARIEASQYWDSCNDNLVWPSSSFAVIELEPLDFPMRAPIVSRFCWE